MLPVIILTIAMHGTSLTSNLFTMQIHKVIFLSGICAVASITAHAQNTVNKKDTSAKTQQLQPIEVRALRATSNAPFAKSDISAEDIEKDDLGQDMPVLLQYTPSATTTSDAGTGVGYTGISIRGTDPTRINITFNGIPVNDPEEQAVYFVDIPDIASSTGSIQIERGVGTSTNGAGAFGGTISISNLQQFDSAGAVYSSSYGSFNTMKNTLLAGTGMLKGGWQFDVRLSKTSSDGYIQRAFANLKAMQFTVGWKPNENTWFHFLVMAGTEQTGQAWDGVPQDSLKTNRTYNELGLESNGTYYNNQTDNYLQDYYQLFADHKFSSSLTGHIGLFLTRGEGYYEEYTNGALLNTYGITKTTDTAATDLIQQLWLNNYYYGGVFSLLYNQNKTHLTLGGGWNQFENQHYGTITWVQDGGVPPDYKFYNQPSQKNDLNIYLKVEQNVGNKLILFGDVQYRNVAINIYGFPDNPQLMPAVDYSFFNPKAGITYILTNTNEVRQKLYASIAVGNREPNYADFEASPNQLPTPETLYDGEAGYEIDKRKWSFNANAYYMYYHDQLVLTGQINNVGAYTETNVPVSYRTGLELIGSVTATKWLKLAANATVSQNKIQNYIEYLPNYDASGNYLGQLSINHSTTDIAFSPDVIGAVMATVTPFHHLRHGQHFEIGINEKYVGLQYLDNTSNAGRVLNAYSFCNVLFIYRVKVRPFKEMELKLALNNVFGAPYSNNGFTYPYATNGAVTTENYYFPQAGFNVLGGVSFKW